MKLKLATLLIAGLAATQASADECGKITIAEMNWNSASLMANLDQFILNEGYGCSAELIPGDTMPTGASMIEKAQPDIAPEMWTNALKESLDKGVADKRLRYAGKALVDGGEEGFWVPSYMVEQYPELATIEGLKKHAKLFPHPEDSSTSAFYNCPAGWNCQISAGNLFKALNLSDTGFTIVDPGSSAGLSGSIAKAYEREEAWFGYYWAPTAILGKYEMVKVDFGTGVDKDQYLNCVSKEGCESPEVTMYPPSPVSTVVTEAFANREPALLDYLNNRGFSNTQMNALLAWMEDNQATGEDAMFYFLETYPETWKQWLPKEVADKVASAL
ncbi:ABC transporter substrate-binding protein [Vibrio sp. 404]|uniref:ABC transporter substrate-binding protein n=1 Tax=Vibrio marinisediminis TaxID=2758441 RepID=A0A7W2FN23_9VIBR|nr:ABC transporter substrate-binding protein [Vibrio marinisediminis]MBA5761132.1 ABC transporter substrate-binding protein [Vibrio marinisediminis]